ncbi:MAG: hypothetical protein Q9166_005061 [cf. Caloplaca sp. 2 TL-2023]
MRAGEIQAPRYSEKYVTLSASKIGSSLPLQRPALGGRRKNTHEMIVHEHRVRRERVRITLLGIAETRLLFEGWEVEEDEHLIPLRDSKKGEGGATDHEMALLISLFSLACRVTAAPNIGLPINSQVPPVARVSKAFNFTFSESTFSSSTGSINYAASDMPAWLQLDSSSRALSGISGPDDAGSTNFSIIATDTTGSTTMPVTLVVSIAPGPGLGTPVQDQLSAHDGFQAPDTILLPHSSALSLSFSSNTFVDTNHDTVYYAMCANNNPLPSWITFDVATLSFSGTAPQNTSPDELPQTFGIKLTASDVAGFSAAVASFQVTVENHLLIFEKESYVINMTQGLPFKYDGLQAALKLNGHPIDHTDVRQVQADVPSWISFDQSTWVLSGVPPFSARTQNISVAATDVYGEVATTTVLLQMVKGGTVDPFEGFLGSANATIGMEFNYTFKKSMVASPEAELDVDTGAASSWLQFDQAALQLRGRAPMDLQPQNIVLNVTLSQGLVIHSEPLTISIQSATHSSNGRSTDSPSPSASSDSTVSSPKTAPSSQNTQTGLKSHEKSSRLAAAIAVPVIAVCLLLILACFVIARRKRRRTTTDRFCESKRKVSRPFPFYENSDRECVGAIAEKPAPVMKSALSRTPIIDRPGLRTSVASKRHSWLRLSKGTTNEAIQTPETDSWHQYMQGLSMDKPNKTTKPLYSLVPEEQGSSVQGGRRLLSSKHLSHNSRPFGMINVSPSKRIGRKKRRSEMSFASSDLLASQRMSGFGHGRNGSSLGTSCFGWGPIGIGHGNGGPPGFGPVKKSWRNPSIGSWAPTESTIKTSDLSSSNYNSSERSQNIGFTMRSFPRPPTSGTLEYHTQPPIIYEIEHAHGTSIRAVEPEPPPAYGLPLHAFHKRRARNRHHRNTFFAAGPSSRASSHLNWIQSIHSPRLSPTQSMNSVTSMISKGRNSRLERSATRRTYSQSSSLEPPTFSPDHSSPMKSKSPRKRTSGASSNNEGRLAALISNAITQRFYSSKSSVASSERFGSAAGGELAQGPDLGLKEDRDEEGNRRWRHVDVHPNPLGVHTPGDSPRGSPKGLEEHDDEAHVPTRMLESLVRTTDGMSGQLQRLSYLRQQGAGDRQGRGESSQRRVVVGGSRGKRPVSVDNGLVARGSSMRGDLVDVEHGDVAFL